MTTNDPSSHGGARKGAGRKSTPGAVRKGTSVSISAEFAALIDRHCGGLSRALWLRAVVDERVQRNAVEDADQ